MLEAKKSAQDFISDFYKDDDFEKNRELAKSITEKHFDIVYKNPVLNEHADEDLLENKALVTTIANDILGRIYNEEVDETSLNDCITEVLEEVRDKGDIEKIDNYGLLVVIVDFYSDERKVRYIAEEEKISQEKPTYAEARKYMEFYYRNRGLKEDEASELSIRLVKEYYDVIPQHYTRALLKDYVATAILFKIAVNTLVARGVDVNKDEIDTIAIDRIVKEVYENTASTKETRVYIGMVIIVLNEYLSNRLQSNAMIFIRVFYDEDDFVEAHELANSISKKYFAKVKDSNDLENTTAEKMLSNKPLTTNILRAIIEDYGYKDVNEDVLLECITEVFEEIEEKEMDNDSADKYAIAMIVLDFYIDSIKDVVSGGQTWEIGI